MHQLRLPGEAESLPPRGVPLLEAKEAVVELDRFVLDRLRYQVEEGAASLLQLRLPELPVAVLPLLLVVNHEGLLHFEEVPQVHPLDCLVTTHELGLERVNELERVAPFERQVLDELERVLNVEVRQEAKRSKLRVEQLLLLVIDYVLVVHEVSRRVLRHYVHQLEAVVPEADYTLKTCHLLLNCMRGSIALTTLLTLTRKSRCFLVAMNMFVWVY